MKTALLIAAAFAATATTALADVNPGKAHVAALGIDPAAYSLTELSLINEAKRANNDEALNYYLSHTNRKAASSPEAVTPAEAQLAAKLRLDPALYTQAELDLIDLARRNNNDEKEAFYVNHVNRQGASAASIVVPGEDQLAGKLGLDAAQYTQAELVLIEQARRDNNDEKAAFYINHVNRAS